MILDPKVGRIGYKNPKICMHKGEGQLGDPVSLSWQEAAALAHKLAPLITESIESGGASRASECIQLLLLEGRLP